MFALKDVSENEDAGTKGLRAEGIEGRMEGREITSDRGNENEIHVGSK